MEAISTSERRKSVRRPLMVPARILLPQLPITPVRTVEISLGGIGILSDAPIASNSACAIAFELRTLEESRRVNIWGTVTHTTKIQEKMYRSGIELLDTDSASRQLLQMFIDELTELE
ncbi:PilZ domain-containing protein [Noviherbaspirillum sp. CPCC 100848]|uniref:PilZ domain-containing protein n=1 Tax=Noviherbaspirillum album TaxID=3080276 RepID=A0ABU6JFB0_9BURK|nr:PilZ domain-containing protein [Noviherbaspirillum sp. CPCC 100848]MEC4722348.1 PilZ domain-containing protein [Noviherbaspirillum sp. CPCC 100848]